MPAKNSLMRYTARPTVTTSRSRPAARMSLASSPRISNVLPLRLSKMAVTPRTTREMFLPQRFRVVAIPPKFVLYAAYSRPTAAISAHTGQPSASRAVLMPVRVAETTGAAFDTAHIPALKAVTASTAAASPPARVRRVCPTRVSATQRRASAIAPRALASAVMAGKKALPTAMARFVSLLDRSCSAFSVVLLRVSNSACMEPA